MSSFAELLRAAALQRSKAAEVTLCPAIAMNIINFMALPPVHCACVSNRVGSDLIQVYNAWQLQ